jgi:hypothetical protein
MQEYLRVFRPLGPRFRRETPIRSYVVDFAWLSYAPIEEAIRFHLSYPSPQGGRGVRA